MNPIVSRVQLTVKDFSGAHLDRGSRSPVTGYLATAYQQARDWLDDSQSLDVLAGLNAAAGKLAASVRRELSRDEAVDLLLTKPYDIDHSEDDRN